MKKFIHPQKNNTLIKFQKLCGHGNNIFVPFKWYCWRQWKWKNQHFRCDTLPQHV